jgi:methylmalonyl-CoA mutase N-terminal domain/subunit
LRTQQIIAFESGVADTVDPLGGSFALEAATDDVEREASAILDEIEERGGALAAIERGDVQRAIQEAAYRYQKAVETEERVVVGVNRFAEAGEEPPSDLLRLDPVVEGEQVARLRALRERREREPWRAALSALADRAHSGHNLMPAMVDAVMAWATVGEIAGTLREVFGEYREHLVL